MPTDDEQIEAGTFMRSGDGESNEGSRAQHWRQEIMRLSIKDLSELTGYSVTAIRCFEANCNTQGELFGEMAWKRYRTCCAGVLYEDQLMSFTWTQGDENAPR